MDKQITNLLNEEMYNLYKKNYPAIFSAIQQGVDKGMTPKKIKAMFLNKFPNDKLQCYHAECVANHMSLPEARDLYDEVFEGQ